MNDYIQKQNAKIKEYKESDLYTDEQKEDLIKMIEEQIKEYNDLQEQKANTSFRIRK